MNHPLQDVVELLVVVPTVAVVGLLARDAHRRGMARVRGADAVEEARILSGIAAAAAVPDEDLDAICVVLVPNNRPLTASIWEG